MRGSKAEGRRACRRSTIWTATDRNAVAEAARTRRTTRRSIARRLGTQDEEATTARHHKKCSPFFKCSPVFRDGGTIISWSPCRRIYLLAGTWRHARHSSLAAILFTLCTHFTYDSPLPLARRCPYVPCKTPRCVCRLWRLSAAPSEGTLQGACVATASERLRDTLLHEPQRAALDAADSEPCVAALSALRWAGNSARELYPPRRADDGFLPHAQSSQGPRPALSLVAAWPSLSEFRGVKTGASRVCVGDAPVSLGLYLQLN